MVLLNRSRIAAGELQHFVLRAKNVVVHQLARFERVAALNSFEYSSVLTPWELSVVLDINRRVHDAFHLTACRFHRLQE